MGIHDLLPLLRRSAPMAFRAFDAWREEHRGVAVPVAIDTPIFMHKFAYSVGTGPALCRRMLRFASDLRASGLVPTFVFDGGALPAKDIERDRRKDSLRQASARRSEQLGKTTEVSLRVSGPSGSGEADVLEFEVECSPPAAPSRPTSDDYAAVRAQLTEAGVPVVAAKFEAEAKCVAMVLDGSAAAVLTEDSDALAYACPCVVLHWGSAQAQVVCAPAAASELGLTPTQFQDMCVLLGNDFNARPRGVGPVRALRMLRDHGSLEAVLAWASASHEPAFEQMGEAGLAHMRAARDIFRSVCHEA
jgi:flap endonuclease-1